VSSERLALSEGDVMEALRAVIDPEMAIDIVALGLVYGIEASPGRVALRMTMTSAACPVAGIIMEDIVATLQGRFGAALAVDVELAWDPPWTPERMSESARDAMGW
jgi:metal-sulfur cluster biosynthetic enzyme